MQLSAKMAPSQNYLMNPLPMEPVSRTYQYRKIMKPMLERKRRARINKCLDELKDLMTGTLQADGENVSKLEKADILELTVRHLQRLRENNALFIRNNESISMEKFWAGFQHCAVEVSQFLNKYDQSISGDLYKHIVNYIPHLATAAANYQRIASAQIPKMSAVNSPTATTTALGTASGSATATVTSTTTSTSQPLALRTMPGNLIYIPRHSQTSVASGTSTTPVSSSTAVSSLTPLLTSAVASTLSASNLPMSCPPSTLRSVDTKSIRQMFPPEAVMAIDLNQLHPLASSASSSATAPAHPPASPSPSSLLSIQTQPTPPIHGLAQPQAPGQGQGAAGFFSNENRLRLHPYAKVIKTETESGSVWRPW